MLAALIVSIVTLVPAFFIWSAIHEYSHYFIASHQRKVVGVEFKLYPHVDQAAGFRWAAVKWYYLGVPPLNKEQALISVAPRFPDLLAVLLTPLVWVMPWPWLGALWLVLMGAGLVDLFVGSIGYNKLSDLKIFCEFGNHDIWIWRILGWTLTLVSAGISLTGFIVQFIL